MSRTHKGNYNLVLLHVELPHGKVIIACSGLHCNHDLPILHRLSLHGGPVGVAGLPVVLHHFTQHHNWLALKLPDHPPEVIQCRLKWCLSGYVGIPKFVTLQRVPSQVDKLCGLRDCLNTTSMVKAILTLYCTHQKLLTHICGNHFHYWPRLRYKWSSRRHKHSSGRSISKAAQHFGAFVCTNPVLFVRSLPILRRSLLICGTPVPQTRLEICAKGRHVFFGTRTMYHNCVATVTFDRTICTYLKGQR